MRHPVSSTVLAVVLAFGNGCVSAAESPVVFDAANPTAVAGAFRPSDMAKLASSATRVGISSFQVEFITSSSVSAQTSGFGGYGRASVSGYYTLGGVGPEDFQAVTDALHRHFSESLMARGYTVLGAGELGASATHALASAKAATSPAANAKGREKSLVVSATGVPLIRYAGEQPLQGEGSAALGALGAVSGGLLSGIGSGFQGLASMAATDGTGMLDFLKAPTELDAMLIDVRMRVHFVELDSSTKGFLGRLSNTASVSGKPQALLTTSGTHLQVRTDRAVAMVTLTQPIVLPGDAFVGVRDTTSTQTQVGNVAGALLGALIAGGSGAAGAAEAAEKSVDADPAAYRSVVTANLRAVGDVMMRELPARR